MLLMLLTFLLPTLPARSVAKTIYTLPIEYSPPLIDRPLIKLQFGKSRPMTLAFDTGCSVPLILRHTTMTEILRANSLPQAKILKKDHYATQLRLPWSVTAVAVQYRNHIVLCRHLNCWVPLAGNRSNNDEANFPKIDGVAGISLFSAAIHGRNLLQLDLAHHMLRLLDSKVSKLDLQSTSIDMRCAPFAPGDYQIKWSLHRLNGQESCWIIPDTGSAVTIVSTHMAQLLHLSEGVSQECQVGAIGSVKLNAPIALASVLKMMANNGRMVIEKNIVVQWSDQVSSLLGLDFLSRYIVTFDPGRRKMWLKRINALPPTYLLSPGDSGITVSPQHSILHVTGIDRRLMSADQAVHVGDEIMTIDGYDASILSEEKAQALIDGYADTVGFLMVRSVGSDVVSEIGLLRRSPFSIDHPDSSAATWTVEPHGILRQSRKQALIKFTNGRKMIFPYLVSDGVRN